MKAYKLFRVKKSGEITSLFINKKNTLKIGEWLDAYPYPTKGYTFRPYWHCVESIDNVKHLSLKNRKWFEVEIEDYKILLRSEYMGGKWLLAKRIKIIGEINPEKI